MVDLGLYDLAPCACIRHMLGILLSLSSLLAFNYSINSRAICKYNVNSPIIATDVLLNCIQFNIFSHLNITLSAFYQLFIQFYVYKQIGLTSPVVYAARLCDSETRWGWETDAAPYRSFEFNAVTHGRYRFNSSRATYRLCHFCVLNQDEWGLQSKHLQAIFRLRQYTMS